MERGSIATPFFACAIVVALSIAVVVVLFGLGFGPMGQSSMTRAYFDTFNFIYGPMLRIVVPAFDRLPVGGWVIGFVGFTTAVTIQNLLVWFIGKAAVEHLRRGAM